MPLFCDQYEMAEAIHCHGLGLVFHKDELLAGNSERLTALMLQGEQEPRFRDAVRRHAHLMRLRAGCGRAAEVIESIVHVGADFQELWKGPFVETSSGGCARSATPGFLGRIASAASFVCSGPAWHRWWICNEESS